MIELGVTDRELVAEAGTVLFVQTADGYLLAPKVQFDWKNIRTRILPGISAMASVLNDSDQRAVAVLMVTPAPELNGLTPIEAARAGGRDDGLATLATRVRAEWA